MKLQISFDMPDLEKALAIAHEVEYSCDIFEIGTILMFKYGIEPLTTFKKAFPSKTILADTKIIDHGRSIITLLSETKVDSFTVMAGAEKEVIHAACTAAHTNNKKIMLDLLDASSPEQSALEAQSLGINTLLFHLPTIKESLSLVDDKWNSVKGNTQLPIFIAIPGSNDLLEKAFSLQPAGIVVGTLITQAEDPARTAHDIHERCSAQ